MKWLILPLWLALFCSSCQRPHPPVPNILFIMMDDLGYGQFGVNNDTLAVRDFDPYFVSLVNERQDYSPEEALSLSQLAIPTMNQLAREGILFTHAFTSNSLCSPSRLGIATGVLQTKLGVYRNTDSEESGLPPGSHLAERLQGQGYATAHIGKWHIGRRNKQMIIDALHRNGIQDTLDYGQIRQQYPAIYQELKNSGYYGSVIDAHHPLQNGFDYYFGYNTWASQFYNSTLVWENYEHAGKQSGYNTDVFTDKALAFMETQVRHDKPFYLQLHYHAVHDSLEPKAPDSYFNRFDSDSYDLKNFYAHMYGVDANIKRILDFLELEGQRENTLIVFTSDNGAQAGGPSVLPGNAPFSGHKGTYYQGGIRVPMFMHWPAGFQPQQVNQLVSTLDILPTLIDAAGGILPAGLNGKSLQPLLNRSNPTPIHEHLIWAGLHSRAWGFLLETSYKNHVTEREFAPPAWVVVKGDYLLRYVGLIEPDTYHESPEGGPAVIELFNFRKDPAESHNLAESMPDKVQELMALYRSEAGEFQPPHVWKRSKWEEIR